MSAGEIVIRKGRDVERRGASTHLGRLCLVPALVLVLALLPPLLLLPPDLLPRLLPPPLAHRRALLPALLEQLIAAPDVLRVLAGRSAAAIPESGHARVQFCAEGVDALRLGHRDDLRRLVFVELVVVIHVVGSVEVEVEGDVRGAVFLVGCIVSGVLLRLLCLAFLRAGGRRRALVLYVEDGLVVGGVELRGRGSEWRGATSRGRRTFSRRAFFEASLMTCFGACLLRLFLWYLELCAPMRGGARGGEGDGAGRGGGIHTHLVVVVVLDEVEFGGDEAEEGLECRVVFFEGGVEGCR